MSEKVRSSSRRSGLSRLLGRRALLRLAGKVSFERGEEYAAQERVVALVDADDVILANVRGSADYRVRVSIENGALRGTCTCPMGASGSFCKHCVAASLVWLSHESIPDAGGSPHGPGNTKAADLRELLGSFDTDQLIRLVFDVADEDPELLERIRLRATRERASGPDLIREHRRAIDRVVRTGGGVAYRDAYTYAGGINEQIRGLEALLRAGRATEVIDLTEHFIDAIEEHLGDIDDSDGMVGECLRSLCDLHLQACRQAMPDPVALAERLLAAQLRSDYAFEDVLIGYAGPLGQKGLAAYAAAAEKAWSAIAPLAPGASTEQRDGRRGRLAAIMEALAERARDVDRLVAVLSRDLADEWAFVKIAETYRAAGRHDEALECAERGAAAFPGARAGTLLDILVDEYQRRGRRDEAMSLLWSAFEGHPGLDQYQALAAHAAANWPAWRSRALELLRRRIAAEKRARRSRRSWGGAEDRSALVRVFLWESDILAAWSEAEEGGCADELWLQIAERIEVEHPEKALTIYQAQVDPTVARMHREEYQRAAGFVRRARELMRRLGRESDFASYLASVRAAHRRKRNFIRFLDNV